jgi:predicted permease
MGQDLRCSIRTLGRHRAFTAVAALVLALGFGINTALFSIVYSVFFKPLPVHAPHELVYLYWVVGISNRRPSVMPFRDYEVFRDHGGAFRAMTAHWGVGVRMTADDQTDTVRGEWVLANYFDVLGVKPMLGRTFRPEEDQVSNIDFAIVISHDLWTRKFRSDPAIIGQQVRLNAWERGDRMFTVVGVTGPQFTGVSDPWTPSQFWVTFAQSAPEFPRVAVAPIARLNRGATVTQARAVVATIGEDIRRTLRYRENTQYVVFAAKDVRMPFWPEASVVPVRLAASMTIVVAMVLLIAAANIAGMLLARGVSRTGELAVRLVLGATAWRIARQLLTESVLLASLGGALGIVLAYWLLALFRAYTPDRFVVDVAMEPQVLALAAAVCLGVGVLIGLLPAVRGSKVHLVSALPGAGVSVTNRIRSRLRHWVVIPQVGLSLVLLVVAAVHVRGLTRMELNSPGYDTTNVVVLSVSRREAAVDGKQDQKGLAEKRAQRSREFYRQLMGRIGGAPAAGAVALAGRLPLGGNPNTSYTAVARDGYVEAGSNGIGTSRVAVSPGYFRTMGMSLLAGRDFDERDTMTSPRVAIISESITKRLWPGREAIGRFVAARNNFPGPNEKIEWLEVIGVVNEVDPILRAGQSPFIYLSHGQEWLVSGGTIIARVQGDPQAVVQDLKRAVAAADLFADVHGARTMKQMVAEILYPRRLAAAILAASGLIGLVLASVGLYGVVSYSVAQRVHEIGVRSALGARRSDIMHLVIREGLKVAAIGSALGLVAAYAAIRVTSKMFAAIPAVDPATIISVPAVLGAVVLLACYLPARRAARVDPMTALREL